MKKVAGMSQLSGTVALVTGASAGLGAATATSFAQRGAAVFGIAEDAARMAEVFADMPLPVPHGTAVSLRIPAPRRMMEPDGVATTIAFLSSDDASTIHGAVYQVDNGKGQFSRPARPPS